MVCPNCKKEIDNKKICLNCKHIFISEEDKNKIKVLLPGLFSLMLSICTFIYYFSNKITIVLVLGIILLLEAFINLVPKSKSTGDKAITILKTLICLLILGLIIPMIINGIIESNYIVVFAFSIVGIFTIKGIVDAIRGK